MCLIGAEELPQEKKPTQNIIKQKLGDIHTVELEWAKNWMKGVAIKN